MEDGGSRRGKDEDARSWSSALRFLKPTNPPETLALVLLCSALLALGGGAVKAIESIFAEDRWEVRADRVCLSAGDKYLSVKGNPADRMRERIGITRQALAYLDEIGSTVPIESTLAYQSMLGEKREVLRLLERELERRLAGDSTEAIENRRQGVFIYGYAPKAEELGLGVCGQGTGMQ